MPRVKWRKNNNNNNNSLRHFRCLVGPQPSPVAWAFLTPRHPVGSKTRLINSVEKRKQKLLATSDPACTCPFHLYREFRIRVGTLSSNGPRCYPKWTACAMTSFPTTPPVTWGPFISSRSAVTSPWWKGVQCHPIETRHVLNTTWTQTLPRRAR